MKVPCKDCPDRVLGCHDTCEKYQEFKAYREKIIQARAEEAKRRGIIIEQTLRNMKKGS